MDRDVRGAAGRNRDGDRARQGHQDQGNLTMAYTAAETESPLEPAFESDLLAIADTKLVLGNWYAECVTDGRSRPDFAGLLGMCTTNYGHTRALYQCLAAHGHDYA